MDGEDRGQGGDATGAVAFTLLVDRAHPVNLQDSPLNSADAAQAQRIRTARDRAAWENMRRATPNPADEYFLASGDGLFAEKAAPTDAARAQRDAAAVIDEIGGDAQQFQRRSHALLVIIMA